MDARGDIYRAPEDQIPEADKRRLAEALQGEHHEAIEAKLRELEGDRRLRTAVKGAERPTPVLYLDMDGTVRHGKDELGRFVNGPQDVVIFPEVPALLRRYKDLGWRIVGCSNQGGVALGYVGFDDVRDAMVETQRQAKGAFDKLMWCVHHPDATNPMMAVCWCRKPRPGLVLEAAFTLGRELDARGIHEIYPPHMGLFVGDRPEDAACAENAGLPFMAADVWRTGKHLAGLGA
jgi:D-glycero-D-manno-heptose 1,7-bisphosphate phosphatase